MSYKSLRNLLVTTTSIFFVYIIWQQKPSNYSFIQTALSVNSKDLELIKHFKTIDNQRRHFGNWSGLLVPYFHQSSMFLVAPQYRLATCQISKNMATIRFSIFCFLNNTEKFLNSNHTISTVFWNYSFCGNEFCRDDRRGALESVGVNATLFAVIRHPVERFLSGYVDRCLNHQYCFGCETDLRCFVEALHVNLFKYFDNPAKIMQNGTLASLLRHFAPQTWFCDFKNHKDDYILIKQHMGPNGPRRIAEEFDAVLKRANVPGDLRQIIHSELLKGKTKHSTNGSSGKIKARQQLLADSYLMEHVMQMFYYDFIEFGFF